jgi:uncharacterized protein YutE (UPF0331/DUF86 family)/predicted nucleotidyltransferase
MNYEALTLLLKNRMTGLLAVYAFGSRVHGTAGTDSDLDLAVLVEGKLDPVLLFELAGELEDIAGCRVDLVDLRAASTVMQYQVLTTGRSLWARDIQAALFEAALDMGQHRVRREGRGVPQSTRDVFALFTQGGCITPELADGLKRRVGFRNSAVHDDRALQLPIPVAIIEKHLSDFESSSSLVLTRDAAR